MKEKLNIGERILLFRARNKLSQRAMGERMNESLNMIFKAESGVKLHTVNRLRLELKMDALEEEENA